MVKETQTETDVQRRAQALLLDEAKQNVREEELVKFWQKYQYFIYIFIIAIVLSVAAVQLYKSHKQQVLLADSDTYENAVVLNAKGQTQDALQTLKTLESAKTNYKYLSMIRRAGILFEEKQPEQAFALLQLVQQDKNAPEALRVVALFATVAQQIDTKDPQELQPLIAPYLAASSPWYGTAVELQVFLLLRQQKSDEAVSLIDQALTVSSVSQQEKDRLSSIKQALTGK